MTPGYGVLVDASAIANSDFIDGVSVNASLFENNSNVNISSLGTAIKNFVISPSNTFKGSASITDANTQAIARQSSIDSNGSLALRSISTVADLCYSLISTSVNTTQYNYQICVSNSSGEMYYRDALWGTFPITFGPNVPSNSFIVRSNGVKTGIALIRAATASSSPATGATITAASVTDSYGVLGGSTLSTLSFLLPPIVSAGQDFEIDFQPAVTTLTVKNSAGTTVATTSAAASSNRRFRSFDGSSWTMIQ